MLDADASYGVTNISGRFLGARAISTSWLLGLEGPCARLWLRGCSTLKLQIEQPLRIEDGHFDAELALVPEEWIDPLVFTRRSFSAVPSGRELDLSLTAARTQGRWGIFQLEGRAAYDRGNIATDAVDYGVMGNWRVKF
jgi:hypothetical protein